MKMIVDSSVWISHFRKPVPELIQLLEHGDVLMHSAVIGELACGSFRSRTRILSDLKILPRAEEAKAEEVFSMIENRKLHGKGLGWVDCLLLASAVIMEVPIFTHDKALTEAVSRVQLRR